jgi:probable phosphoglycerate mutase
MELHLIRHGESEWHKDNRYAGHTDISLSREGRSQAETLASWGKIVNPDVIFTADLSRAVDTAKPMGDSLGLIPFQSSLLREVNFGSIEGLTPEEFKSNYPKLWQNFSKKPALTRMPEGESGISALDRAWPMLKETMLSNIGRKVVVVFHGTLMRLITCRLLGIDLNEYRRVFPEIQNLGRIMLRAKVSESADRIQAGIIRVDKIESY